MSATSAFSSFHPSPRARRSASGVSGRSAASVRSRYRRQTAALMIGTTVMGLWLGFNAPTTSPVAPPPAPVVTPADDLARPSTPTIRRNPDAGAGRQLRVGRRGARR